MLYGLIKKVVIADNLAPFVRATFTRELTTDSVQILVGIVAFAIQIYLRFLRLHRHRDRLGPGARAPVPRELQPSVFLEEHHRILAALAHEPLAVAAGLSLQSRSGAIGKGERASASICWRTMVLGGLWHGASWNFVIWGLYQGVLLAAHRFLIAERRFLTSPLWDPLKILVTFYLTCLGWLIFITPDLDRLWYFAKKLLFIEFHFLGLSPPS